ADQQAGEFVGFVSGQTVLECVFAFTTVHPAIPLAVVVFVPNPGIETTALFGIGNMRPGAAITLVPSGQMPFSEVARVVSRFFERLGQSGLPVGKRILMPRHALVRIAAGE